MTLASPQVVAPDLAWMHPLVRDWFVGRFGTPTEPQSQGWPHILAGKTTLISAPTGSGKTLAAFLACIDRLVRSAVTCQLVDRTEVIYVSPLKALSNDIQKNLELPLSEIQLLAGERGILMPEIRVAVRTGDTPMWERQAMLKQPPHILVTTPESLYILLTAQKSREILKTVETVIVDEIHAVADDKRGAHLALSLERLEHLANTPPVRIGLSATQKPLELVAQFLTGNGRTEPEIVQIGQRRTLDLAIEVPASELGPVASNEMWGEIYDRIADLARQHRSTLIFVNTRRLAERVAHHLGERIGKDAVAAHHGSLSRKLRLAAEKKLKAGEVRALVATASLELGIDIGSVDLVCVISSPRAISVALQRIGRAGHWRGAIPKGRIFATTRDELLECAALVRAIRQGDLDILSIPESPLDILAQQIVASCAAEDWSEEDLFHLVRRAYPYRNLTRVDFDAIVEMLSEGIAARRGRFGAYLHRDRVNGVLRARRGARLAAITSGGAIPENSLYSVVAQPEGAVVGTVDEDFAVESLAGDIMLLGNTSWRIRRVESGRVLVEDAQGAPPNVPFWRGEAPGRTAELSQHVSALREKLNALLPTAKPQSVEKSTPLGDPRPPALLISATTEASAQRSAPIGSGIGAEESLNAGKASAITPELSAVGAAQLSPARERWVGAVKERSPVGAAQADAPRSAIPNQNPEIATAIAWLKDECCVDQSAAEQLIEYILAGRAVLGAVPMDKTIVAERFFDESGGMQLVIHAPFGARINKAWGLALRKRFCRSFNFELQAAATDNGLNISLAEQHSFPLADVFNFLSVASVQHVLEQASLASPLFTARWRWDAGRSLALLRFRGGKRVAPNIQRMLGDDLLAAVFPESLACPENLEGEIEIPNHPLIREVMKDVLTEAMDIDGLREILGKIATGEIKCLAVDTPIPSQFSHEILNANPYAYLDDAPLEERRARAVEMRRMLPETVLSEVGRLDPAAIAEVRADAWPDVRDAEELHDALLTLVVFPVPKPLSDNDGAQPNKGHLQVALTGSSRNWSAFFEELAANRRAARATANGTTYWIVAERAQSFTQLFPGASFETPLPQIESVSSSIEDALLSAITGWMFHAGPVTARELSETLHLPQPAIDRALLRLEASGTILRGQFTGAAAEIEWCERRLLARIHRLTIGSLRKQIQPVTPAQFMRWLLRWQHVAPASQLIGERGTLEVLQQLQGFEAPANSWERQILSRRISGYDPKILDQLCLTGAVGWGRLSPHPATLEAVTSQGRRVIPTSVAPITFFVREDSDWMLPRRDPENQSQGLSRIAQDVLSFLRQRGASFFADIVRGSGKLKSEVETGLWELVAAGMITADGFDNLRSLIDPKRRSGHGSGKTARPRDSAGRWSLLHAGEPAEHANAIESTCWMLLRRYGVVFREVLARESILPRWRELLVTFRRLEDRGEIRGGRFVSGFLGEQFSLPLALESLRAFRTVQSEGETIVLSAADPLNFVGILVPGERVAANSSKFVAFRDGAAIPAPERPSVIPIAASR
ncbi:MAG TPA: DEAD/DEAH box helicase [Candidatus Acidoferrales bacterium]|nr:DEAD/DEAH box helicase [Candidatus Acidoferrales bacterium]